MPALRGVCPCKSRPKRDLCGLSPHYLLVMKKNPIPEVPAQCSRSVLVWMTTGISHLWRTETLYVPHYSSGLCNKGLRFCRLFWEVNSGSRRLPHLCPLQRSLLLSWSKPGKSSSGPSTKKAYWLKSLFFKNIIYLFI